MILERPAKEFLPACHESGGDRIALKAVNLSAIERKAQRLFAVQQRPA
jgi:hypothetical protein